MTTRFQIRSTSGKLYFHNRLIVQESEGLGYPIFLIDIGSLEHLLQLVEECGMPIIMWRDNSLEVYDGYRE